MERVVSNPTSRTKAVRDVGGHKIIKPGDKVTVNCEWSDLEEARYVAAGLKFGETKKESDVTDPDAAEKAEAAKKAKAEKAEAAKKAKAEKAAEEPVTPVVPSIPTIPTS